MVLNEFCRRPQQYYSELVLEISSQFRRNASLNSALEYGVSMSQVVFLKLTYWLFLMPRYIASADLEHEKQPFNLPPPHPGQLPSRLAPILCLDLINSTLYTYFSLIIKHWMNHFLMFPTSCVTMALHVTCTDQESFFIMGELGVRAHALLAGSPPVFLFQYPIPLFHSSISFYHSLFRHPLPCNIPFTPAGLSVIGTTYANMAD